MSASDNRRRMQDVLLAMSQGNPGPLSDATADDMRWISMGTGRRSHTFKERIPW